MKSQAKFIQTFFRLNPRKIYFYSICTGILTGFAAILFYYLLSLASHYVYEILMGLEVLHAHGEKVFFHTDIKESKAWLFFIVPSIGGLLVGLLSTKFSPEAAGTGTEAFLDSFHNKDGLTKKRISVVKALTSIITLSTGGSAGKEGPVAQIGSGLGALVARFVKAGARARRTLLLVGAAGGLGAIFKAPLGGALTAVEVLYKEDLESDALIPCILSSVMAYTVFCSFLGFGHLFEVQVTSFHSPIELIFYVFLAITCSLVGKFYLFFFHQSRDKFFEKLPLPLWSLPAIGGFFVGCIAYFYPQIAGPGLGLVQSLIDQASSSQDLLSLFRFFIILAFLKILATSFTVSSGGSGGVFGPSLFIGGMLGGAIGCLSRYYFPDLVPDVVPFIIVGMAAFFAGVAHAPIASLIMVCELTGGYELLPPLMVVAVLSLIFSGKKSIYRNQVLNKFHSKAHLWDMNPDLLKKSTIKQAFQSNYRDKAILMNHLSMREVKQLSKQIHAIDFLIKDEAGFYKGILSLRELYFDEDFNELEECLVVEDLSIKTGPILTEEESLYEALEKFSDCDFDKLPVLRPVNDDYYLLGYLREKDILVFYRENYNSLSNFL